MIKYHRPSGKVELRGGTPFAQDTVRIWFKGYFWQGDLLIKGEKAISKVYELYQAGNIEDEIPQLNGFFFVVIYDAQQAEVLWAHDRFGYDMHFILDDGETFLLSDDFWTCVNASKQRSFDTLSILELLRYRFMTDQRTPFKDVYTTCPASIERMSLSKAGERSKKVYFQFERQPTEMDLRDGALKLHDTLQQVTHRWRAALEERPALTLTGGLASRYLFALLHDRGPLDLYTFGASASEDLQLAQKVATAGGKQLHATRLENFSSRFFDPEQVLSLVEHLGHSCHYYQGFALKEMFTQIPESSSVIMGVDGFWMGLNARPEWLYEYRSSEALVHNLFKELSSFLSADHAQRLIGVAPSEQEQLLKSRLEQSSQHQKHDYSSYLDWIFKHKARRYISANFPMLSTHHSLIYPYDDHSMIDLGLSMPSELLEYQNVFIYALLHHGLSASKESWGQIPFELVDIIPHGERSYRLQRRKRALMNRALNKLSPRPDKRQSHPIPEYVHSHWKACERQWAFWLEDHDSSLIDQKELARILKEQKSKNLDFFTKPLSAILTILSLEMLQKAPPWRQETWEEAN